MEYKFNLIQDGIVVASVQASDREKALGEISHYALLYGQDGPIEIKEVVKKGAERE